MIRLSIGLLQHNPLIHDMSMTLCCLKASNPLNLPAIVSHPTYPLSSSRVNEISIINWKNHHLKLNRTLIKVARCSSSSLVDVLGFTLVQNRKKKNLVEKKKKSGNCKKCILSSFWVYTAPEFWLKYTTAIIVTLYILNWQLQSVGWRSLLSPSTT